MTLSARDIPDVSKICSTYRPATGLYDYFAVRKPPQTPSHEQSNQIGIPIDDALPALPRPAKLLGSGPVPIGTIVSDARLSIAWADIVIGAAIAGTVSAIVGYLLRGR